MTNETESNSEVGTEESGNPEQFFDESLLTMTTGEIASHVARVWDDEDTFQNLLTLREDSPLYRIFDGPPFATGIPHYGHFMPMSLKDCAFRYQSMNNRKADMKGGWDTHGVPVETLVQKELGLVTTQDIEEFGIEAFSEACRGTVLRYVDEWNKTQRSLGRWIDMENPYTTMDANYIESVWWIFAQLHEKGLVHP